MDRGDLYLADVPFREDPTRGKTRIVLVVKFLSDDKLLLVESRGKPHPNLELIGAVDFSRRGYAGRPYRGTSHFYLENVRILDRKIFRNPIAGLTPADFKVFFDKIDPYVRQLDNP